MKKEIQFDYFEVHAFEMDKNNNVAMDIKMDITPILENLLHMETVDRTQNYKSDKIRFQVVHKKDNSIWEIQLLRLREVLLPGIADDEGNYEIITLEDGQYIGESTSMIYDSENCVICMQRNNKAILPSILEYLLRSIYDGGNELITLRPIIRPTNLMQLNNNTLFRKISIGIATDEIVLNEKHETPIGKILNNMQEYDCGYITLELGFNGRLKKNTTMASGPQAATERPTLFEAQSEIRWVWASASAVALSSRTSARQAGARLLQPKRPRVSPLQTVLFFSEALFFLLRQIRRLYYIILSVAEQEIMQKIRRNSIKSRRI